MNLIGTDSLSLKKRKSNVRERSSLCCSAVPILALHHAIVGGSSSERDSISFIIRAHPGECTAARHPSLEMINV